jgi:hypothetical protein
MAKLRTGSGRLCLHILISSENRTSRNLKAKLSLIAQFCNHNDKTTGRQSKYKTLPKK